MKHRFYLFVILFALSSCVSKPFQIEDVGKIDGIRPIYYTDDDWRDVYVIEPQPIINLRNVYYYEQYIFVAEYLKGIHIFDNSDPTHPVQIKFIRILGNGGMAVRDGFLYVDNYTDLVTLDIHDINNIHEVGRVEDYYDPESLFNYPEFYHGYFECVEPDKGVILGWEAAVLENPDCYRE